MILTQIFCFFKYYKNGNKLLQYVSYLCISKKAYDWVQTEVGITLSRSLVRILRKLFRLIKMCLQEIHSRVWIVCPILFIFRIGETTGCCIALFLNFVVEYTIMKDKENKLALKFNGTH